MLIFFTGFALYASSALLPQLLQTNFGYDATLAGLVLSPGGLALIFLMPLSGKLVAKIQSRYLIRFGLVLMAYGMWASMHITPQTDYDTFVSMRVLQVLGLPFLFIPTSTLAFSNIPKELSNKASALFALGRNLGGSMGIAILGSYVARHSQIHQSYLTEHLVPGKPVYEHTYTTYFQAATARGMSAFDAAHAAMGKLYHELIHQASILAYNDAFQLMVCIMLSGIFLTLFLPGNPVGKKALPAEAVMAH